MDSDRLQGAPAPGALAGARRRRRERGAALSVYAAVMGVILVAMGVSYLGGTMRSVQAAKVREHRAIARAAARGALQLAIKTTVPSVAAGERRSVEFEVGGVVVPTIVESKAGVILVQTRARSEWAGTTSGAGFMCEAKLEGGGVRILRMQPAN